MTITGADGDSTDAVTVAMGDDFCGSLDDGTHDSYDAVTGVLTKRVKKVVFDGLEDEAWALSRFSVSGYARFYIVGEKSDFSCVSCDRFRSGTFTEWSSLVADEYCEKEGSSIGFSILSIRASTIAAFKAWLASNPVTVYYAIATPITVQLAPHLPVVHSGIKTLTVGADVVPTISATVKSMD